MSDSDLIRWICRLLDVCETELIPVSMQCAGAVYVGVRSMAKKFGSLRFKLSMRGPRFKARRRRPAWLVRALDRLKDFLIEALVIVGGSVLMGFVIYRLLLS